MGTSSVRSRSISKRMNGGSGGGSALNSHLETKSSIEILDLAMRELLPLLPNGNVKTPIYCAASELIRYAYAIDEQGVEKATISMGVRITKEYLIPHIANAAWENVESHIVKNNLEFPWNKFAEEAFKRTLIEVMDRGVDAIAG